MLKPILQTAFLLCSFALLLFVSAGRIDWPMAWAFLGVYFAVIVFAFVLVEPDLLRERSSFETGGNVLDAVLASLSFVWAFPVTLIVAGLDVGRYGWSPTIPVGFQALGLGMFALGNALGIWAMMCNRFFSDFVRIQTERGHHVITSGPYAVIRHPGYAGGGVAFIAVPVALGSWLALLPVFVGLCHLVLRIVFEERKLKNELSGYRDYMSRVRWRLVPGIW
jgi:protein-S-isoprenylcysteine O-methyltransferase Ste14